MTGEGDSLEAVEETVALHLDEWERAAQEVVWEAGYMYTVDAQLVTMEFEDCTYEDLMMPAGKYDALRITIGEAAGQNWWCVMYHALCVLNACEVSTDAQTEETAFDACQQDLLEHHERYAVRLKCVEWLERMFS